MTAATTMVELRWPEICVRTREEEEETRLVSHALEPPYRAWYANE